MRKNLAIGLFVLVSIGSSGQDSLSNYRKDFEFFMSTIQEDYCYWDKKTTDWTKVRSTFAPIVDTISSTTSFILTLEKVFNEIYDHHASLSSNTALSQRLVPSGTDLWAEYVNGKPLIIEVRQGFGAWLSGLKAGMEVTAINNETIDSLVNKHMPSALRAPDVEAKNYILRTLLAGKFIDDRKITVKDGDTVRTFYPDRPDHLLRKHEYTGLTESRILDRTVGYIRINNCLWDNALIPVFDSVLATMSRTRALILDLRETPSGGNTTVARSIIGSFIEKEAFYQKHELTAEERIYGVKRSWKEIVSPRKHIYKKPLVILANHWTGSVGEAIVIAFDGLKRGHIIGTTLARLNGAIYSYQMPETKIGFSFPVEKLFHVNETPRENFVPRLRVDMTRQKAGQDLILETAIQFLNRK
jgi:C-terminal processing protease CtpA/Prc